MVIVYEYMVDKTQLIIYLYLVKGSWSYFSPVSWEQSLNIFPNAARGLDNLYQDNGQIIIQ